VRTQGRRLIKLATTMYGTRLWPRDGGMQSERTLHPESRDDRFKGQRTRDTDSGKRRMQDRVHWRGQIPEEKQVPRRGAL